MTTTRQHVDLSDQNLNSLMWGFCFPHLIDAYSIDLSNSNISPERFSQLSNVHIIKIKGLSFKHILNETHKLIFSDYLIEKNSNLNIDMSSQIFNDHVWSYCLPHLIYAYSLDLSDSNINDEQISQLSNVHIINISNCTNIKRLYCLNKTHSLLGEDCLIKNKEKKCGADHRSRPG